MLPRSMFKAKYKISLLSQKRTMEIVQNGFTYLSDLTLKIISFWTSHRILKAAQTNSGTKVK